MTKLKTSDMSHRAARAPEGVAAPVKVSVVVNTKNEQESLDRCLRSAAWADEIVVLDMNSGDATVSVARKYTDKVFHCEDFGYVEPARNVALTHATGDWVFVLDADEEIPARLAAGVRRIISESDDFSLVAIPRRNYIGQHLIRNSGWGLDYQPRLFRRGKVEWAEAIHSWPRVEGEIRYLDPGDGFFIKHYNYVDLTDFVERLNRYTSVEAAAFDPAAPRFGWRDILREVLDEFERRYTPREDGFYSLALAGSMAYYRFLSCCKKLERTLQADGDLITPLPPGLREIAEEAYDQLSAKFPGAGANFIQPSLSESQITAYEEQGRRQEEELSQARGLYEEQIRRQDQDLVQARAGYESQIASLAGELARSREAHEAQVRELSATLERERAKHWEDLRAFEQARSVEYGQRVGEVKELLAREREAGQTQVRELTEALTRERKARDSDEQQIRELAATLAQARQAYETRLGGYEARLGQYAAGLEAARARLAERGEALSAAQSKLDAARAQLDKWEDALTWMHTSRSGRVAAQLRHFLEVRQDWQRLGGRVRAFLGLPPKSVFHGFIDSPAEGASAAGGIEITGWVFSDAAPVTRVEAFIDDLYLGRLNYGVEREDVLAAYPAQAHLACGYHDRVVPVALMHGRRRLTVRAHDERGNVRHFTRSVVVEESHGLPLAPAPEFAPKVSGGTRAIAHSDDAGAGGANAPAETAAELLTDEASREVETACAAEANEASGAAEGPAAPGLAEPLDAGLRARLAAVFAEFQGRAGVEPSVLDWDAALANFQIEFQRLAIFSPPAAADSGRLPYIDESVDIVVLSAGDPAREAEARRVAAAAVILVRGGGVAIETEWKVSGGGPAVASASIIIPVHNKVAFTEGCLARLRETLPGDFDGEIIVVDDASTDATPDVLDDWARRDGRVRVLRNEQNLGFIGSCNRGAEVAAGEVLVFLNNDTLPQPGWLPPLLRLLRERADAGAVGGKLIYPDGTLQEAGGIIYSDGSGCNFGRDDARADAPLYSFVREVDYCSGALLATPRALFRELGGFDTRFAPAYYEDADYCFSLRERGYRVYYQPESVIVHFEGVSSGTDITGGVKMYQAVNRTRFFEKWKHALERRPAAPGAHDFTTQHALSVRDDAEGGGEN